MAISSSRNAKINTAHSTCRYRVLSGILSVIAQISLSAYHYSKYRPGDKEISKFEQIMAEQVSQETFCIAAGAVQAANKKPRKPVAGLSMDLCPT
jgi:hypothetical protein